MDVVGVAAIGAELRRLRGITVNAEPAMYARDSLSYAQGALDALRWVLGEESVRPADFVELVNAERAHDAAEPRYRTACDCATAATCGHRGDDVVSASDGADQAPADDDADADADAEPVEVRAFLRNDEAWGAFEEVTRRALGVSGQEFLATLHDEWSYTLDALATPGVVAVLTWIGATPGAAEFGAYDPKAVQTFDRIVRREMGMAGAEFVRRWDAGEWDGVDLDSVDGLVDAWMALPLVGRGRK